MDNQNSQQKPPSTANPPVENPVQPPPFITPPTSKSFLSNKILLLIVIIIILIAVGGKYLALNSKPKPEPVVSKVTPTSGPTPLPSITSVKESSPTASPIDETANWKTYTSQEGKYSIRYPDSVKIYVNEKFSVDGVKIPVVDTTMFVSDELPQLKTNYQMSINHKITGSVSLKDFIDKNSPCQEIQSSKGKTFILDGRQASIFENVPCGPYGMTVIYALNNGIGYIIQIETHVSYNDISKFTNQILSTLKFTQ